MKRNSIFLFAAVIMVLAVSDASAQDRARTRRDQHAVNAGSLATTQPGAKSRGQRVIYDGKLSDEEYLDWNVKVASSSGTPSARSRVIMKDGNNTVTLENYAVTRPRTTSVRVATGDVNSDGSSFASLRSVAKDESITIGGGRSEEVGAASMQSSRVGVQGIMGQQQSTFTSTSNIVQGNHIGTNVRMLNNKNPELNRYGVQARGNDLLMEETSIVHEGIELKRSGRRSRN